MSTWSYLFNKYLYIYYYFLFILHYYSYLKGLSEKPTPLWLIWLYVFFLLAVYWGLVFFFYRGFYRKYKNSLRAKVRLKKSMIVLDTFDNTYFKIFRIYECYKVPEIPEKVQEKPIYRYLVKAKVIKCPPNVKLDNKESMLNLYDVRLRVPSKLEKELVKEVQ